MNFFLFTIIIFFVVSCSENAQNFGYKPNPVSIIINEIEKKVFSQLQIEKNLYPFEFGGGGKDPVKLLHFGFLYFNEIEIKEARELIITAGDQFLKEINANEQMRPYLANFPFKPENIQVEIFLKRQDKSEIGLEKLRVITMRDAEVRYYIRSSETKRLTIVYKETYDEASRKLDIGSLERKSSSNSCF